jgi:hypothetical protein
MKKLLTNQTIENRTKIKFRKDLKTSKNHLELKRKKLNFLTEILKFFESQNLFTNPH